MDESQIRSWLQPWLPVARKRLGLSQEKLSRRANVGIGTVREIEQNGRVPELEGFLRLVVALGDQAVNDLVNQLAAWRIESGELAATKEDAATRADSHSGDKVQRPVIRHVRSLRGQIRKVSPDPIEEEKPGKKPHDKKRRTAGG